MLKTKPSNPKLNIKHPLAKGLIGVMIFDGNKENQHGMIIKDRLGNNHGIYN